MNRSPLRSIGFAILFMSLAVACGGGGGAGGTGGTGGAGAASFIGVWDSNLVDPFYGPFHVQLVVQSNGTFQKQWTYQAGAVISIAGTWRYFADLGLLRLDTTDAVPTSALVSESDYISQPDNNTLVVSYANCNPNVTICQYAYARSA